MTVASVMDDLTVTCSRGVKLVADKSIWDVADSDFDLIALPVSVLPNMHSTCMHARLHCCAHDH